MKWRTVEPEDNFAYYTYLWHFSSSLPHHCVVIKDPFDPEPFYISNKYYVKNHFDNYPNEKAQEALKKKFFEKKYYSNLINYIFTQL